MSLPREDIARQLGSAARELLAVQNHVLLWSVKDEEDYAALLRDVDHAMTTVAMISDEIRRHRP